MFTLSDSQDLATYRAVTSEGVRHFEAFLASPPATSLIASGRIVRSVPVDDFRRECLLGRRKDVPLLLECERIPFPSYPAEWPPEMLHAAAHLTLGLAHAFLPHGIGLKEATPYSLLFRGPRAVFADVLCFELRDHPDKTWAPCGQFLRTFLLPLLANRGLHIPLEQIFSTRRDGLDPEEMRRWTPCYARLLAPFRPIWRASRCKPAGPQATLRHLSKLLASVAPTANRKSAGSAPPTSEKLNFVRDALAGFAPSRVLDIGCHSGHFSVIAAQSGADVTAIDSDPIAAGALWRRALFENLPILPLVVNLVRPTPAAGWNNAETPSFLDRARGHFDAVLMLSPIPGIPPAVVLDLAAELVSHSSIGIVVVESAQEDFAAASRRRFDMVRAQGNLYLLRRKP